MGISLDFTSNYDKEKSFELCIVSSKDFSRYGVFDYGSKLIEVGSLYGEDTLDELQDLLGHLNIRKQKLAINTNAYSFVPNEYCTDALIKELSDTLSFDDEFAAVNPAGRNQKIIWDASFLSEFEEFDDVKKFPLIQGLVNLAEDNSLNVFISDDDITLVLRNKGELLLTNSYDVSSEKEILYFIMLALHLHKLDREVFSIRLSGEISGDGSLFKLLDRYLGKISFAETSLSVANQDKGRAAHWYHDLYAISKCE